MCKMKREDSSQTQGAGNRVIKDSIGRAQDKT